MGNIYISRSQARRVLVGLDKFKSIIFDFDRVPTIGQAFADEIFRVFAIQNPQIELKVSHANAEVSQMISRARSPRL